MDVFAMDDVVQTKAHVIVVKTKSEARAGVSEGINPSFRKSVVRVRDRCIIKISCDYKIFAIGKCRIHAENIYLFAPFSKRRS